MSESPTTPMGESIRARLASMPDHQEVSIAFSVAEWRYIVNLIERAPLSETEARWIPVAEEIAKVRIQAVTATLPIFTMHKGQWYRLDGLKEPK